MPGAVISFSRHGTETLRDQDSLRPQQTFPIQGQRVNMSGFAVCAAVSQLCGDSVKAAADNTERNGCVLFQLIFS